MSSYTIERLAIEKAQLQAKVEKLTADSVHGWRSCIDHIIRPDSPCPVCKVEELTAALEQASLNFNRSTKYGKGWHDALAYVKQAALKQEGRLERSLSRSTAFPASQAALEQEGE